MAPAWTPGGCLRRSRVDGFTSRPMLAPEITRHVPCCTCCHRGGSQRTRRSPGFSIAGAVSGASRWTGRLWACDLEGDSGRLGRRCALSRGAWPAPLPPATATPATRRPPPSPVQSSGAPPAPAAGRAVPLPPFGEQSKSHPLRPRSLPSLPFFARPFILFSRHFRFLFIPVRGLRPKSPLRSSPPLGYLCLLCFHSFPSFISLFCHPRCLFFC